MPKRSALEKIAHYENKIKKLEQKERRRLAKHPFSSSSEYEGSKDTGQAVEDSGNCPSPVPIEDVDASEDANANKAALNDVDCPSTSADPELDPEILAALGESSYDSPEYGDSIHSNLPKLWQPLLTKGLPKEGKEKLIKEYLIPDNCRYLQAPKLNAEISAAIPDMVRNRDKTVFAYQQQLGSAITAINRGLDILLKSDNKAQAMTHISNGCRLLCDSHYSSTQNRIKLITPSLDKTILHVIHESERDETLFGSCLHEKIKSAKVIEKQGLQIKKVTKPSNTPTSTRTTNNQGNWPAPPRYSAYRGGRGGYKKQPASGARRPQAKTSQRASNQERGRAASSQTQQ